MSAVALQIENLVKVYSPRGWDSLRGNGATVRAVDGMSFEVAAGSIFGLLGPNGAGKTTLLKMLTTLVRPTNGTARIQGFDVVRQPLEVRKRISLVLQETAVELFLSVRDNLLTFARFQGLGVADARRRADQLMAVFQLGDEADRKAQDLSGGFRRRVQVAKVFLVRTPVVFLDEFSTGMDPILKRTVMDLLRREAASGRTIILTTQILSEAEELCDDILIMNRGKQVARGDLHTLKLLSQGVYEVTITFAELPESIAAELEGLQPLRSEIRQNSIEVTLKTDETRVLEIVAKLSRMGKVRHVEVSGASLEDVFVKLTHEKK